MNGHGNDLTKVIRDSYGETGKGILFVRGIPGYVELRKKLLLIVDRLGKLPEHVLALCEREKIFYTRGWSRGREKFNGKPDYSKGSYYFKGVRNSAY